jgi:hypothetical protein
MKPRNYIFWIGVIGIAFVLLLQFCAIPMIDRAHGRYSEADRVKIAAMRERAANGLEGR